MWGITVLSMISLGGDLVVSGDGFLDHALFRYGAGGRHGVVSSPLPQQWPPFPHSPGPSPLPQRDDP